jgi:hypothetical protein
MGRHKKSAALLKYLSIKDGLKPRKKKVYNIDRNILLKYLSIKDGLKRWAINISKLWEQNF